MTNAEKADSIVNALRARGRLVEASARPVRPNLFYKDGTCRDCGQALSPPRQWFCPVCDPQMPASTDEDAKANAPAPAAAPGAVRQYRKRPVVISAIQLLPDTFGECLGFIGDDFANGNGPECSLGIRTLEGTLNASRGDFIVRGVKGEHYAVKPDIFAATYDEAAASPAEAGGWIACSERMPDPGKLVGVYGPWWSDWPIATYSDGKQMRGEPFWFAKSGDYGVDAVTHWRALPDPPAPAQAGEGQP